MKNPENVPAAIIAAAAPQHLRGALAPLSLARIALLETLDSPLVITGKPWTWQDFACHSYIMRSPIEQLARASASGSIRQEALAFADTLSIEQAKDDLRHTLDQLTAVSNFLPGDDRPGEAPQEAPATAG